MITPLELLLAFALDALVGDPRWLPHPVRIIGRGIEKAEALLRKRLDGAAGGVVLVVIIVGASALVAYLVMRALRLPTSPPAAVIASTGAVVYLVSTTLALRGLLTSVRAVFKSESLDEARRRLGLIVGRDTGGLDREAVWRAAIESLSENASDGVVAPLFYLALGGLPLAVAYKAVNTLDSMVGYRNERYREFGRASARLDDLLNYLPARLTGLLIVVSSMMVAGRKSAERSLRIMLRDGKKHASPNSGIPEAAMAGALGMRLGGPSTYGGEVVGKPFIGDETSPDAKAAHRRAMGITAVSSTFALILAALALHARALI